VTAKVLHPYLSGHPYAIRDENDSGENVQSSVGGPTWKNICTS